MPYQHFTVVFMAVFTQHGLIAMIEKPRKILDNGGIFDALLPDLSKAFNCMKYCSKIPCNEL